MAGDSSNYSSSTEYQLVNRSYINNFSRCGKFGDYPVERCLKQMDRAYNFGDNQVLQMYGFTHKSLASRRVKRIRNESSTPLELKDELGLLHPPFKAIKLSS